MEKLLYSNDLNVENFIHMLDDTTECYKFYWLDSVLKLLSKGKTEMEFEEIIDGMIADAWYSVKECHLHLGPKDGQGKVRNYIEKAVYKLAEVSDIKSTASPEEVLDEIKKHAKLLHEEKCQISKNVPYRLLSSFLSNVSGNDRIWDQKKRLIDYIQRVNKMYCIPYEIEFATGLKKKVIINPLWKNMLIDNMVTIRGWIQNEKVKYLQNRNPEVPGIIYKLEPENEKQRKLNNVRTLWTAIMEKEVVLDIYSDNRLNNQKYDVDHFIPWNYIANDEIWNLMPMESKLNSSKNKKLPDWELYFSKFASNQYLLYRNIFESSQIRKMFENCRRDNVVSIWANEELYISGNSKERFNEILKGHLKPIYDSARIQGFKIWTGKAV